MATRIHASWLSHQHNYLDLDPTYKGAYGLPLRRRTFDWYGNDPRKMRNLNKRRTDIGRALNGSGLGHENTGTRFGITGYQSTHDGGGAVMGSDPSTSVVNTYSRSWDVSNLFVVGGSAFPRNPANGPPRQSVCLPVGRPMRSRKTTFATQALWSEQRRRAVRWPGNLLIATRFPHGKGRHHT
jgi:gluconate 2-dehydrogenase alpha chain